MIWVPPPEKPHKEAAPCGSCGTNLRIKLKSGEYDTYCADCRSARNKDYGKKRRLPQRNLDNYTGYIFRSDLPTRAEYLRKRNLPSED